MAELQEWFARPDPPAVAPPPVADLDLPLDATAARTAEPTPGWLQRLIKRLFGR